MLYTYTPESVGGRIQYKGTTHNIKENLHFAKSNVAIREGEYGQFVIEVKEGVRTVKIISTFELEFQKHPTDNYFFPILDRAY